MGSTLACIEEEDGFDFFGISGHRDVIERVKENGDTLKTDLNTQIVWEFQRFHSLYGWGAGSNFEPGDPGRWSSHDMKKFGETLDEVAPEIPPGFKIELNWAIVIHKRSKKMKNEDGGDIDATGITDRFGWHYSTDFYSRTW